MRNYVSNMGYAENECRCGEDLIQLDGEWLCPECDDVRGFELVPDRESFEL